VEKSSCNTLAAALCVFNQVTEGSLRRVLICCGSSTWSHQPATIWCFAPISRVCRLIIHAPLSLQVVTKRGDYTEVDVKRYVRIEKIPGGELSECIVLDGVMFNKVRNLCPWLVDCRCCYRGPTLGALLRLFSSFDAPRRNGY
jgi:hypothetical protein